MKLRALAVPLQPHRYKFLPDAKALYSKWGQYQPFEELEFENSSHMLPITNNYGAATKLLFQDRSRNWNFVNFSTLHLYGSQFS